MRKPDVFVASKAVPLLTTAVFEHNSLILRDWFGFFNAKLADGTKVYSSPISWHVFQWGKQKLHCLQGFVQEGFLDYRKTSSLQRLLIEIRGSINLNPS